MTIKPRPGDYIHKEDIESEAQLEDIFNALEAYGFSIGGGKESQREYYRDWQRYLAISNNKIVISIKADRRYLRRRIYPKDILPQLSEGEANKAWTVTDEDSEESYTKTIIVDCKTGKFHHPLLSDEDNDMTAGSWKGHPRSDLLRQIADVMDENPDGKWWKAFECRHDTKTLDFMPPQDPHSLFANLLDSRWEVRRRPRTVHLSGNVDEDVMENARYLVTERGDHDYKSYLVAKALLSLKEAGE